MAKKKCAPRFPKTLQLVRDYYPGNYCRFDPKKHTYADGKVVATYKFVEAKAIKVTLE